MTICKIDLLKKHALEFRVAIEKAKHQLGSDKLSPKFLGFPDNCCGVAANLLAMYLESKGCGTFEIAGGWNHNGKQHHWLQQDDVIIDITADQFGDSIESVIVTTEHDWHDQFNLDAVRHVASATSTAHQKMLSIILAEIETPIDALPSLNVQT